MPLRQLQIHLPISYEEELSQILEKEKAEALWQGYDEPGWSFNGDPGD
ncbi:MAG: hypothetical protein ACFCU1_13515 [Sumerlaeia bacterium]